MKDFLKKNELWTMEILYMEFERICNTKHLLLCLSNIKAKLTSYENSQQILHVKLYYHHEIIEFYNRKTVVVQ